MSDHSSNTPSLTISHELLQLLQWLIHQEPELVASLVEEALESGLAETLHQMQSSQELPQSEELYHDIAKFFTLLESHLQKAQSRDNTQEETSGESEENEKSVSEDDDNENNEQHEDLYKEFLRNWTPKKSHHTH